jgi:ubiquitin C-terminal hydrolase
MLLLRSTGKADHQKPMGLTGGHHVSAMFIDVASDAWNLFDDSEVTVFDDSQETTGK